MQRTNDVLIDEEIDALIPRLSPEELAQLEQNILAEGCRDKLVVWDDGRHRRLLDGHNRLAICKRHGLGYEVDVVALPDREAAILWVLKHQLGRRNLSPEALSYLRGRLYIGAKRQGARTDLTSGQSAQKSTTAGQLAAQHKVDEKTIRRDAKFAEEIDQLAAEHGEQIKKEVLARDARITRKDVRQLLALSPLTRERVIADVRGGSKASTLLRDLDRHNSERSPSKRKKTEGALGDAETALQSVERATKILGNILPGAISAEVLDRIDDQVQCLSEEIKRHQAAPMLLDGPRVDVLAAVSAVFELENEGMVSAPMTSLDAFFADPTDPQALYKQFAEVRGMIRERAGNVSRSSTFQRRAISTKSGLGRSGERLLSYKTFSTIERYLVRHMPTLERLYNHHAKTRAEDPKHRRICETIDRFVENGGHYIVEGSFNYADYLQIHCVERTTYERAAREMGQEMVTYFRALNQFSDKVLERMRKPSRESHQAQLPAAPASGLASPTRRTTSERAMNSHPSGSNPARLHPS
jgi:hypothetical protein